MILKNIFVYLFVFNSFTLFADHIKRAPFVTCWLNSGQLGNQLHEIATTLAYAWDNKMEPLFPALNQPKFNLRNNKKKIFFRLNASPLPRNVSNIFNHFENYEMKEIPIKPDLLLRGYFQTWEYYHHHRDKLIKIFAPSEVRLQKLKLRHKALLEHPDLVGVHVRTFDKTWGQFIPFIGMDYYKKAIALFPENTCFVVFSDRINWCKRHFKEINRPIVFIDNQDYIDDFFLMSMMKHNIIGNSSFSWWAAYLNNNPEKIVVAPSHFLNPISHQKINLFYSKWSALLPEWIVVNIDYNKPYPEDLTHYDSYSQSIDNN